MHTVPPDHPSLFTDLMHFITILNHLRSDTLGSLVAEYYCACMSTMQQLHYLVALLLAAAAPVVVGANAQGPPGFVVTGRVYCDACRAGFETNASHSIPGAVVQMECRHFETQQLHHKAEATTDQYGWYKMQVGQDHQEEICEVALLRSPEPDCAEIERFRDRSRVPLTRNNGIKQSGVRYANPIAFFRKTPLASCGEFLRKYDLYDMTSENP